MRRVLVTGGAGFIGRWTCMELVVRGYTPVIFDHDRKRSSEHEVFLGDIRDATTVNEAVAHVDGLIHLGGVLGTQETILNPRPAAETNVLGGLNVLEAVAQYDVPAVNIAVGNYWMNNTYSITKNTVERFTDMFRRFRGTRVTTVRALNAYGPFQNAVAPWGSSRVRKVMPTFVNRALDGDDIEVYGDGEQVMDMIWVGDVARILVTALEQTEEHGGLKGPFEAGTGRPTTINDVAKVVIETVARMTDSTPVSLIHLPMRPGEDERSVVKANPQTLRGIGIDPDSLRPLEEGVRETVAYFEAARALEPVA